MNRHCVSQWFCGILAFTLILYMRSIRNIQRGGFQLLWLSQMQSLKCSFQKEYEYFKYISISAALRFSRCVSPLINSLGNNHFLFDRGSNYVFDLQELIFFTNRYSPSCFFIKFNLNIVKGNVTKNVTFQDNATEKVTKSS